jgi:hypothetical protein
MPAPGAKPSGHSIPTLDYGVDHRIPVGKLAWAAVIIQAVGLLIECYFLACASSMLPEDVHRGPNEGIAALGLVIGTFAAVVAIVPLVVRLRRRGFRSEGARRPTIVLAISILALVVGVVLAFTS